MNNQGQYLRTTTLKSSRLKKIQLRHLIVKYHILRRQIKHFDKKYIGYTPSIHHSRLQEKFGTSSLGNIKNVLKMKGITNNIHNNLLNKHTENYDVNQRLNHRINNIQGKTIYHQDNHHFAIPEWKMKYLKIHNIKQQRLLQLKSKIQMMKAQSRNKQRNSYRNISSPQGLRNLQDIMGTPQEYQNKNFTMTKHHIYNKPMMKVHPHTIQHGYQHPRHPERFQHQGFSI